MFGGIERQSPSNCFMVEVKDISAVTLLPIILDHAHPGTIIISDEWRAYCCLSANGMTHLTVNHSINFVDPSTGTHKQNIEGTWSTVKRMLSKEVMNTFSDLFQTSLQEFVWRKKHEGCDFFFFNYGENNIHYKYDSIQITFT